LQRWGKPIGPAQVIGCYQDDFNSELDQYEVWRVEWTQEMHFGSTIWTDDGDVPNEIRVAFSPDIGSEEDYHAIVEPGEESEEEEAP
jgi:hypothetical protein